MLLDLRLEKLIIDKFGEINKLQKQAFPLILSGKDVLIIAPTGFGKTEAALLPVLHLILKRIDKNQGDGIQALYITPLRALNRDMFRRITWWCSKLGITYSVRHGDTSQYERGKQVKNPPQLLITTPETLGTILSAKRMGKHLINVRHVIIDEIHSLIGNNRGAQLSIILERLAQKARFNRIGLSATVGSPKTVARYISPDCKTIKLDITKNMMIEIERPQPKNEYNNNKLNIPGDAYARLNRVIEISKKHRTLIFVNTRQVAEALSSRFNILNAGIGVHHGSLAKESRKKTEERFKKGKINGLIATSSLELGIDIGDVDYIIQYMSPRQVNRLVQRIGRSGHTMEGIPAGTVITSDYDDTLESMAILNLLKKGWQEPNLVQSKSYDVIAHQLAGITLDYHKIELEKAHEIMKPAQGYKITLQELRDIAIQLSKNKKIYYDKDSDSVAININTRFYYYMHLSTIPITNRLFVRNVETNRAIAMLDEGFATTLNTGDIFITKGLPWKVVGFDKEQVFVESARSFTLSIPDWEGEEIPVHFEVAQEVGRLRAKYHDKWINGLLEPVPIEDSLAGKIPDDKNIIIESFADLIIIHACFGTLINNTLGYVLAHEISIKTGISTRMMSDPYRIIIQLSKHMTSEQVKEMIESIKDVRSSLLSSIEGSRLLVYKLNHIARMFGLIDKDERVSRKFIPYLKGTPVYKETIRVILNKYFDICGLEKIFKEISGNEKNRRFRLITINPKELSWWARQGLTKVKGGELISPIEPNGEIVKEFAKSILEKTVRLTCTYCHRHFYMKVDDVKSDKRLKCPYCKSEMIAYTGFFKDGKLIEKNKDYLRVTPPLIQSMPRETIIALSVYGVGIKTAKEVLHRPHKNEMLLFLDLLEAQKQFIRTKGFWKL